MKQQDLLKAFIEGAKSGVAKSLSIDGDQLVHYKTAIAERYGNKFILNYTRYSLATGKIQKMITDTIDPEQLVYVSGIPSGTRQTLANYVMLSDDESDAVPDEWLMRIKHTKFGLGYVLSKDDSSMHCVFGGQEKTLLYPLVMESGLVEVLEDRR